MLPIWKRKEANDKGEKYIFLDISKTFKAYKLFNPPTKKIVTTRMSFFTRRALEIGMESNIHH